MNKRLGFSALFFSSILFSTYGIYSRLLSDQLSVFQQLSYRYFLGIVVVLFIILFIKKEKIQWKKFFNWQILFFAIFIPVSFYLFIQSFLLAKLSVSISGFYAGLLISSIFIGTLVFKEKLSLQSILGVVFIFVGFFFLNNLNILQITNLGLLMGFLSGMAYGVTNYFKKSAGKFSKEEMLLIIAVSTTVMMQAISFFNHEKLVTDLSLISILMLIIFIFTALGAEYLTIVGFRNFDMYVGTIVLSLEIVFTVIVGYFFFQEIPTVYETLGIFLIFASVVLSNISSLDVFKRLVKK